MRSLAAVGVGAILAAAAVGPAQAAELAPHAQGRVLVSFSRATPERERSQIIDRLSGRRLEARDPDAAGIEVAATGPQQSVRAAIEKLQSEPRVLYAEPDYRAESALTPSEGASYWRAWQHYNYGQTLNGSDGQPLSGVADADQDTPEAWDQTTGSSSVIVGVIDSGVDVTHPDLDGNVWSNPGESGGGKESNGIDDDHNGYTDDYRGWSAVRGSGDVTDPQGHGTAVSGIIGAEGDNGIGTAGVAWDVSLLQAQWTTSTTGSYSDTLTAMSYATENGAKIINASFTGPSSQAVRDFIAARPSVLFVAAAGNDGTDQDAAHQDPCSAPGANVICVAASTPSDQLAGWSSYGASQVDLAAPGEAVLTTGLGGGVVVGDGTSFAAPQVAGAAALIYSQHPDAEASWVREILLGSVDAEAAMTGRVATGGRLNVASAVADSSDETAPESSIDEGPAALTAAGESVSFTYSSDDPAASFECRLDGPGAAVGSYSPCPGGSVSYEGLEAGSYEFWLRATDQAGNTDQTPTSWSFEIAAPPETQIGSAPGELTNQSSASFTYSSDDPGAGFECRLDGGEWEGCPVSGASYAGLSEGDHSFAVRAVSAEGLRDPSPAEVSWEIDLSPPQTQISSGPSGLSGSRAASFSFSADEPAASFECRLDGPGAAAGSYSPCAGGPASYAGLSDGGYSFKVRATDQAGNTDQSPAERGFTVDATAPQTTISSGPAAGGVIATSSVSFVIGAGGESPVSFECRIDGGPWSDCSSGGASYAGLSDGAHSFEARATDQAGNTDQSPAERGFTVDTTAPQTAISSAPASRVSDPVAEIGFSADDPSASFECRLDGPGELTGSWESCESPESRAAVGDGAYTFRVRASDSVGNTDQSPAAASWELDRAAPTLTITAGPPQSSQLASAEFSYSSDDLSASFECELDSSGFAPCPGGSKSYAGLSDGEHTFRVRASDGLNTSAAESWVWSVSERIPQTALLERQTSAGGSAASFTYSSDRSDDAFQCQLDQGEWSACASSGQSYAGLSDGEHSFRVRAVSMGGISDPTPESWSWSSDTTPPETAISSGPAALTNQTEVEFQLQSPGGGASSYQCRTDGRPWAGCQPLTEITGLGDGAHVFSARAVDGSGNADQSPATYSWTQDTLAPRSEITAHPKKRSRAKRAEFAFSVSDPGATLECRLDRAAWRVCLAAGVSYKLKPGRHKLSVRATDRAGNREAGAPSYSFTTLKRKKPRGRR